MRIDKECELQKLGSILEKEQPNSKLAKDAIKKNLLCPFISLIKSS